MAARAAWTALAFVALLCTASRAAADNPTTYVVGHIPVAVGVGGVEFPVGRRLAVEVDLGVLSQGTYDTANPFAYLSLITPLAWLHWDATKNLRLSLGLEESIYREVPPLGLKNTHEERGIARARLQQPRGEAALYEMLQLDVRSFDDPSGSPRVVFRPRFRVGQGFNLDAVRVHSLMLYQEAALHFAGGGYESSVFDFFRVFAGYGWTTRTGTYVTIGILGQLSLNAPATRFDLLWGPALAISHRFRAAPPEAPPAPPEVDVQ
jgi:hypothetical protein